MRQFIYYIDKSLAKDHPAKSVVMQERNTPYSEKGKRKLLTVLNIKTNKRRDVAWVIGMGYADFKDEQDYNERCKEVIAKKLDQLKIPHKLRVTT